MPLAIRRATSDDIPAILALERQAQCAAHWSEEEYKNLLDSAMLLVAGQDEICGMVCAKPVAGDWELENIAVRQSSLRRGVADSLMRALLDVLRMPQVRDLSLVANPASNAACPKIFLEVRESNLPARRLYEKHGFHETGRRRNYYHNPAEDAILYERTIL